MKLNIAYNIVNRSNIQYGHNRKAKSSFLMFTKLKLGFVRYPVDGIFEVSTIVLSVDI